LQFGRYHGLALAALGFLLICLQVFIGSAKPPHATDATSMKTVEHKTTIVPGAIGGGLFVVGLFFVIIVRRGDKPPDERAVK
jgi:nitrate reductase gamma subunit